MAKAKDVLEDSTSGSDSDNHSSGRFCVKSANMSTVYGELNCQNGDAKIIKKLFKFGFRLCFRFLNDAKS